MNWDDDRPLPEDDAIDAAFPTRTGRHDLYAEAMRLVGAKRSKGALVCLVNWLLARADAAESMLAKSVEGSFDVCIECGGTNGKHRADCALVALLKRARGEKPDRRSLIGVDAHPLDALTRKD